MATDFNQRVRQIFDQALDRPETQRLNFLKSACAGDPPLYEAVERLLRARRASESEAFLDLDATVEQTGQIGRYIIRGELGRGAMGIVYDAVDPMIGRRVAVKVIGLKAVMEPAEAEFMKERLFREARSAGRLIHPNIVLIFDVGTYNESAFITMEHVAGPSLHQLLAAGRLDTKTAAGILRETASALDFAHQHGVVHRDIKPANIMLQDGLTVKVADFGIAKLMSQNSTLTGMLMGTPSYMSPEQIEAQPVDGRSDQFALAVLAFELLTGARPFQAESMPTVAHLIVYGPRPSASALNPSVPPAVDKVLERAWNRVPDQRFPTCTEFVAALTRALDTPLPAPKPAPVATRKNSPIVYVAAIAAVVIFAVGLAYSRFKAPPAPVHATPPAAVHAASTPITTAPAKPTPVGDVATPSPAPAPALSDSKVDKTPLVEKTPLIVPRAVEAKPDPNAKVPASFRAQEIYRAAIAKRKEGKPEDAFALFKESADLGDSNAMEEVGESYQNGDGVNKDGLAAEQWFLRSSVAGNTSAMVMLGAMYYLGDDIPASYEDAAKWFQRAADAKNPAAMYDLAKMYEEGRGVARNPETAKKWYQDAAALGNTEAQHRLAELQARK